MDISFGNKKIKERTSELINKNLLQNEPKISINLDKYHTIVMFDPDAPNGMDEENNTTYLHLLWANNIEEVWMPYTPPNPPRGIHRYVFYLFEHSAKIQPYKKFVRQPFNINEFMKYYSFTPVDAQTFLVEA